MSPDSASCPVLGAADAAGISYGVALRYFDIRYRLGRNDIEDAVAIGEQFGMIATEDFILRLEAAVESGALVDSSEYHAQPSALDVAREEFRIALAAQRDAFGEETRLLRLQNIDLKNQLSVAKGNLVAYRHADGLVG